MSDVTVTEVTVGNTSYSHQTLKDKNPKKTWDFVVHSDFDNVIQKMRMWEPDVTRLQVSREWGEEGKEHLQCKVTWRVAKRWSAMKKLIHPHHFERSISTCFAYTVKLNKADKPEIYIDNRAPGQRNDLDKMKTMIDSGADDSDLWSEHFGSMLRYHKGMNTYRDLVNRKTKRTWMTHGEWLWGATGTGKSHKAFTENPNAYVLDSEDNGWWDGYEGEDVVIINEFRGEIRYKELLDLVDKWPKKVRRRNREPTQFLAKKVVITSSRHPRDIYKRQAEEGDAFEQLERRFRIIQMTSLQTPGSP